MTATIHNIHMQSDANQQDNSRAESRITLTIMPSHLSLFTEFMLKNKIPFSVDFKHEKIVSNIKQNNTLQPMQSATEPIVHNNRSRTSLAIEKIYLKYFINTTGYIIPKIDEIAQEFGVTTQSLKNGFQAKFGKPFYQVYLEKKMEHAARLLKNGQTATYISNHLGYSHPIKFNKMFQKHFGVTPKKYQLEYFRKGKI